MVLENISADCQSKDLAGGVSVLFITEAAILTDSCKLFCIFLFLADHCQIFIIEFCLVKIECNKSEILLIPALNLDTKLSFECLE